NSSGELRANRPTQGRTTSARAQRAEDNIDNVRAFMPNVANAVCVLNAGRKRPGSARSQRWPPPWRRSVGPVDCGDCAAHSIAAGRSWGMQPRLTGQDQKHTRLKAKGVHAVRSWQHAADPARVAGIADSERDRGPQSGGWPNQRHLATSVAISFYSLSSHPLF